MNGIVLNGTMREISSELKADLYLFGDISVLEYQTIRCDIAKYGVVAVNYHKQRTDTEKRDKAIARSLGMSVEDARRYINGTL